MSDFRSVDQLSRQVVVNPLVEMEEHLQAEIPCGGIQYESRCRRDCDKAAVLHGRGHGCHPPGTPAFFKCIDCWQVWYVSVSQTLVECGYVTCGKCAQRFTRVEDFNDFREF